MEWSVGWRNEKREKADVTRNGTRTKGEGRLEWAGNRRAERKWEGGDAMVKESEGICV